MPKKTNGYYSVYPRFTGGSPAMVDEKTALHVLSQERDAYRDGREAGKTDDPSDLVGIVEFVQERKDGFLVHDLATDRYYLRPFKVRTGERVETSAFGDVWRDARVLDYREDVVSLIVLDGFRYVGTEPTRLSLTDLRIARKIRVPVRNPDER